MGRREARRIEQRIHLDKLVRLQKYGGAISPVTGNYADIVADETVWASIEEGRTEFDVAREGTTLLFAASVTIRWTPTFDTLSTGRILMYLPADDTEPISITIVKAVGRRRFLRLEYDA